MHDIDCYSFDMTLTKMHHSSHCFQNTIEPYKAINKYYILKKEILYFLLVYMVLHIAVVTMLFIGNQLPLYNFIIES